MEKENTFVLKINGKRPQGAAQLGSGSAMIWSGQQTPKGKHLISDQKIQQIEGKKTFLLREKLFFSRKTGRDARK